MPAAQKKSHTSRIGSLVAELRERRGMTQEMLAGSIGTSQSAIARIEKGEQNLTIAMLERIGEALGSEVVTLDDIGRKFKLTRERIRQIEKKALRKLSVSRLREPLKNFRT